MDRRLLRHSRLLSLASSLATLGLVSVMITDLRLMILMMMMMRRRIMMMMMMMITDLRFYRTHAAAKHSSVAGSLNISAYSAGALLLRHKY